jgi:hypothetical protein
MEANGAKLYVSNSGFFSTWDTVRLTATVNGQVRYVYANVYVPSHSSRVIDVTYLVSLSSPAVGLCGNDPIGGVDSSEPIAQMTPVPPPPDDPPPGDEILP